MRGRGQISVANLDHHRNLTPPRPPASRVGVLSCSKDGVFFALMSRRQFHFSLTIHFSNSYFLQVLGIYGGCDPSQLAHLNCRVLKH